MGRLTVLGWQALSLAVLLLAWQAAGRWGLVDPVFVPTPTAAASALAAIAGEALPRLSDTLLKTLIGYGLAVGLGVAGGLLIGSARTVHRVFMPYVVAGYGIPKILILPWIALIFGIGLSTAVLSGTLFAVFPIVLMVAGGVRDVDPALVTVAKIGRASCRERV